MDDQPEERKKERKRISKIQIGKKRRVSLKSPTLKSRIRPPLRTPKPPKPPIHQPFHSLPRIHKPFHSSTKKAIRPIPTLRNPLSQVLPVPNQNKNLSMTSKVRRDSLAENLVKSRSISIYTPCLARRHNV